MDKDDKIDDRLLDDKSFEMLMESRFVTSQAAGAVIENEIEKEKIWQAIDAKLPQRKISNWVKGATVLAVAALALIVVRFREPDSERIKGIGTTLGQAVPLETFLLHTDGGLKPYFRQDVNVDSTLVFKATVIRHQFIGLFTQTNRVQPKMEFSLEAHPNDNGRVLSSQGNAFAYKITADVTYLKVCAIGAENAEDLIQIEKDIYNVWLNLDESTCLIYGTKQ